MSGNMIVFADEFENARVYVGTYKKYNNGNFDGDWVALFDYDDKESFMNECRLIHSDEPADEVELMFQDYEGLPECMYSEIDIDEDLWELMLWCSEKNHDIQAVLDYIEYNNHFDFDDLIKKFDGYYQGEYDNMVDFVMDIADLSDVPKWLENYINWERYADDLEMEGYWISDNGHVFAPY